MSIDIQQEDCNVPIGCAPSSYPSKREAPNNNDPGEKRGEQPIETLQLAFHGENIAVQKASVPDFQDDLGIDEAVLLRHAGDHDRALEAADAEIAHIFRVKDQLVFLAGCRDQRGGNRAREQFLALGIPQVQADAQRIAPESARLDVGHLDAARVHGGKLLMPRPLGQGRARIGRARGGLRPGRPGRPPLRGRGVAAGARQTAQQKFPPRNALLAQQLLEIFQPLGRGLRCLAIGLEALHVDAQGDVFVPQQPALLAKKTTRAKKRLRRRRKLRRGPLSRMRMMLSCSRYRTRYLAGASGTQSSRWMRQPVPS